MSTGHHRAILLAEREPKNISQSVFIREISAWAVACLSGAVLLGWASPSVARLYPSGWSSMTLGTSVSMLLLALTIPLSSGQKRFAKPATFFLSGVTGLIAIWSILQSFTGEGFSLNTMLFGKDVAAFHASALINVFLLASAVETVTRQSKRKSARRATAVVLGTAFFIVLSAVAAYFIGASSTEGLGHAAAST